MVNLHLLRRLFLKSVGEILYPVFYHRMRDSKRWIIGHRGGRYLMGNSMYLYVFLHNLDGVKVTFVSRNPSLTKILNDKGYSVVGMFTLAAVFATLRAGYIAYTHGEEDFLWPLSGGAALINMWHGTPLKKMQSFKQRSTRYERSVFTIPDGDTTERHFIETFDLDSGSVYRTGSPRNEAITNKNLQNMANNIQQHCFKEIADTEAEILILFLPTYRYERSFWDSVDLEFVDANLPDGVEIFVKNHTHDDVFLSKDYENLHQMPRGLDVYSLLHRFDLLITDYSSVLFDFLHVDRPIILFRPDDNEYQHERGTYAHIDVMIPADRVESESELVESILRNLAEDPYAAERSDIKDQFVSDPSGACSRILNLSS